MPQVRPHLLTSSVNCSTRFSTYSRGAARIFSATDREHRPKRNRDALSFLRNTVQARVLCCIYSEHIHRDYRVKDVIWQLSFQFG
jgi:hypothetical protein